MSTIGQIIAEFGKNKRKLHKQMGTGSIQIDPETEELYILSWAHIFVKDKKEDTQSDESSEGTISEFEFAEKATLYLTLDEKLIKGEWVLIRIKIPLTSFKIHPKYDKFWRFDLAVAKFEKELLFNDWNKALKDNFWDTLIAQIPNFGRWEEQEQIEIVGHTLNGAQLVSKGQWEITTINTSKILMYDKLTSYAGQSGAPIYKLLPQKKFSNSIWEQERELIGLHIGKYQDIKVGVGIENLEI